MNTNDKQPVEKEAGFLFTRKCSVCNEEKPSTFITTILINNSFVCNPVCYPVKICKDCLKEKLALLEDSTKVEHTPETAQINANPTLPNVISRRDFFAAFALAGLAGNKCIIKECDFAEVAKSAFNFADAMIRESEK
ncbi:MAG: hypothetical protein HQM10_26615 [Candidatus Riflebacteria bacterium]|nr:hypothetical protein [Candidatus Riflebacteria bacterium]